MSIAWLRLFSYLFRFRTLQRVQRAFSGVAAGTLVKRRLFDQLIELDVSRSTAQQLLLLEGERFVEERFLLRRLLRPGMRVVDVGANIGYYLLLFLQQIGSRGEVICVEPSAENLPELRRTISLNAISNVELHEVALGDHEGNVGLHRGINSGVAEGEAASYVVPLRRLDKLVRKRVDFLKIDVEGYEGQVLEGARGILETRPVLFLELHPHIVGRFGYSVRGLLDGLKQYYSKIELFERTSNGGLAEKFAIRYFGRNPIRIVSDPQAYVAHYDTGNFPHTFWAVCRA